ncbi:ZSWM3 protein, partial [Rhinopomastus cyanomelas]|nr:ZSWM3 protein [Rhinopomastus cyanomelas]
MEVGSSFGSYEEFQECFLRYEQEQSCRYVQRSYIPVGFHNRQHGTVVRDDIRFMHVRFGCARVQDDKRKKRRRQNLCPAYFVLKYKEDVDQLVITELNNDHSHGDEISCPTVTGSPDTEPHKTGTSCGAVMGEGTHRQVVNEEKRVVVGQLAPALGINSTLLEENTLTSAIVRITEVIKTFLRTDRGLLASVSADNNHNLDRLNFQTSKMKGSMAQFPERLLLHRVLGEGGHVFYVFLVEAKEREVKVVHLSVLKSDTGCGVRKMMSVFKEFNPEWQKIQAVFVDMSFPHKAILHELLPSAQVLHSIYHTVQLLKEHVKDEGIPSSLVLQDVLLAKLSPSAASASSQLVQHLELYDSLRASWPSCEALWTSPAERGLCTASLDCLMHRVSVLLGQQPSLEAGVICLLEHADRLDSRALQSLDGGILSTMEGSGASWWEQPVDATAEPGHSASSQTPAELVTVRDHCSDLGWWLCMKEWEVVQASSQLMGEAGQGCTVRLLEHRQRVSHDASCCTCAFQRRYRLPCRHVLAVLQAQRQPLLEAMVSRRWQRRFQQLPVPGAALGRPAEAAGGDKEEQVRALSLELANLLLQSEGPQLEQRAAALGALLEIWAGRERVAAAEP